MHRRNLCVSFICITSMLCFSSCPSSSRAVGIWELILDDMCNFSNDAHLGMVLSADGTAVLYIEAELSGVWELSGNAITITFVSPISFTFTGTVTNNGESMVNGTAASMSGGGCWEAERVTI